MVLWKRGMVNYVLKIYDMLGFVIDVGYLIFIIVSRGGL